MKKILTACLLTTALCGASHAEVLFGFKDDAALYSALSGKTGPITVTNSGLIATFTTTNGTMNRTTSGFGINASITGDDTDGFDGAEWIDITFESAVTLSNVTVGSWNAEVDQAIIYVGGVSNGSITSTGGHDFDISVPTGQLLRIVSTAGIVTNNGWSLDSLTIEPDAPLANLAPILGAIGDKAVVVSNELSFTVSATDINGDVIVLSAAGLPDGAVFNTVTNSGGSASNTFTWTPAAPTGTYSVTFFADDGTTNASETINITVTEAPVLPESVTFNFADDAGLYDALDNQTGPITYTNNGLVATFETVNGEMNRTSSGFGINSDISGDDTAGFDTNEWIDITFEIPVILTHVTTSSWGSNDMAVIFINGVSNGVITETGEHLFDMTIPARQVLRIAATNNTFGNGWSLDSMAVRTDTNAPPQPTAPPVISLTLPAGGPITLAWPAGEGSAFNVLTNSNLLDTNGWGNANLIPFPDGDSYKVTNSIGSNPALFYKLERQ